MWASTRNWYGICQNLIIKTQMKIPNIYLTLGCVDGQFDMGSVNLTCNTTEERVSRSIDLAAPRFPFRRFKDLLIRKRYTRSWPSIILMEGTRASRLMIVLAHGTQESTPSTILTRVMYFNTLSGVQARDDFCVWDMLHHFLDDPGVWYILQLPLAIMACRIYSNTPCCF